MSKHAICTKDKQDEHGRIVFMTRSGGYVMCRRPRCLPFVLSEKQWGKLSMYRLEGK
jgi:hypothetical protein